VYNTGNRVKASKIEALRNGVREVLGNEGEEQTRVLAWVSKLYCFCVN